MQVYVTSCVMCCLCPTADLISTPLLLFNPLLNSQCAPACTSCDLLDYDKRCPYDKNAPKAWNKAGDLQLFFERLLEHSYPQYRPTILSGPKSFTTQPSPIVTSDDENSDADASPWPAPAKIADNVVVDGPWVVILEDFLSDEECDRLIKLGYDKGYERSKDVGAKKFDGTFEAYENPKRTSTNAWCLDECYNDTMVQNVTARLEQLTGIPTNHSEYWQLLRYVETQEYSTSFVSCALDEYVCFTFISLNINCIFSGTSRLD
jgi:prolyl 4-hydroxylase